MGTKGYKSTEFWLTLLAVVLNAIVASGALEVGSLWEKVILMGVTTLGALGYTAGRTLFKSTKLKADAVSRGSSGNP